MAGALGEEAGPSGPPEPHHPRGRLAEHRTPQAERAPWPAGPSVAVLEAVGKPRVELRLSDVYREEVSSQRWIQSPHRGGLRASLPAWAVSGGRGAADWGAVPEEGAGSQSLWDLDPFRLPGRCLHVAWSAAAS